MNYELIISLECKFMFGPGVHDREEHDGHTDIREY